MIEGEFKKMTSFPQLTLHKKEAVVLLFSFVSAGQTGFHRPPSSTAIVNRFGWPAGWGGRRRKDRSRLAGRATEAT